MTKDSLSLIAVALLVAALCFAFMRFAGEWVYLVMGLAAFATLFIDNRKLRKRVKELESEKAP